MSRPGEFKFTGKTALSDQMQKLQSLIRGRLTLHDNVTRNHVLSYLHNAGAGAAQTISIAAMKTPWTPSYFIVVGIDASTTIFATSADMSSWSNTQVVLRSSANNVNVKVMLF